jgi:hypothetical protein
MDAKGFIKLVDFGLAKQLGYGKTWTMCGTPDYLGTQAGYILYTVAPLDIAIDTLTQIHKDLRRLHNTQIPHTNIQVSV